METEWTTRIDDGPKDFEVIDHFSIVTIRPLNEAAREWIEEYVDVPEWGWLGNGFGCEPRLAPPIIEGILDAGFTL